ncbi:hypothetical protein PanWU01x14_151310 [Parasponia andersonii]|uniref:Uncharacterized protein n=1 Tax=Parasponia andersonii TaxID=3476 RepID=A0A2P5CHJ8_PARAD|nr:hypothetical protein PanWU01x14_151310 [Parasponia andersonii]
MIWVAKMQKKKVQNSGCRALGVVTGARAGFAVPRAHAPVRARGAPCPLLSHREEHEASARACTRPRAHGHARARGALGRGTVAAPSLVERGTAVHLFRKHGCRR